MKLRRVVVAVAGLGLVAGLGAGPAAGAEVQAKPKATTTSGPTGVNDACRQGVGWFTMTGMNGRAALFSTRPPTIVASEQSWQVLPVKASANWYSSPTDGSYWEYGNVISGSALYYAEIFWAHADPTQPSIGTRRIGGGWDRFTQIQTSNYRDQQGETHNPMFGTLYGLRDDGVLYRWVTKAGRTARPESYPGFSAVKAMTLISTTATYDTLLATLRGGSLYTIRIPVASPMKPIVTAVRTSTWQGFESLVATKCGTQSTLLTGIDHDTGAAYLYAVGHANGLSTPIQSLGKVPYILDNPVHHTFGGANGVVDNLFGE
jgi:hypothetical protein